MQYREIVVRLEKLHLVRRMIRQKTTVDYPMHPGQLHLLEFINLNEGCTQAEAAEHLMISPASVALSTKRMEKTGLVKKITEESNLRCKRLYITEKGKELTERCRQTFDEFDRMMFNGFSDDDLILLKNYLDRLLDNINNKYFLNSEDLNLYSIDTLRNMLKNEGKKELIDD